VDLRLDFRSIIGGSMLAKLMAQFFGGFPAIHPVTNLAIFSMHFLNFYDLV
jgi:hypothetical protein